MKEIISELFMKRKEVWFMVPKLKLYFAISFLFEKVELSEMAAVSSTAIEKFVKAVILL